MIAYLVGRAIASAVLLFLIVTIVFLMTHFLPGDPAAAIIGGEFTAPTQQELDAVREELGLDRPIHVQYVSFITDLGQGDLGTSFATNREVAELLTVRVGRSLLLAVPALMLAVAIGVPLGIFAAKSRNSILDPFFSAVALFGFSTPLFVSGLLLVLLFAITLGWLPSGGYVDPRDDLLAFLRAAILPIITLSLPSLAVTMRMTRSSVLEETGLDYVRTARAKGLREITVLYRHVIRNALLPVVTVIALQFGNLVTGSVIVEFIFSWPGLGRLLITSVGIRDYPVIQGIVLVAASAFIVINFLTDLSYAVIDPRIRYS